MRRPGLLVPLLLGLALPPAPAVALGDTTLLAPGGVAVGGDVSGSTITIGIAAEQLAGIIAAATDPLRKLTDEQRAVIGDLERRLGASEAQLAAFFRDIGAADTPPELIGERLAEAAARFKDLLARVEADPGDDPEIGRLRALAREALERGELDAADARLAEVELAQERAVQRQALELAATAAERGQLALTRLRYRDAARHFAAAASRVPPGRERERRDYLQREAQALFRLGADRGERAAVLEAVGRFEALAAGQPREADPLAWATAHWWLGLGLSQLGQFEPGAGTLLRAAEAFRAVLLVHTRERSPENWAATQHNLASALRDAGLRSGDPATLDEAAAAFRAALRQFDPDRTPENWAKAQAGLGGLLTWRGGAEGDVGLLREAVEVHKAALKAVRPDKTPGAWCSVQSGLAEALGTLAATTPGHEPLVEARAAVEACLQTLDREREPFHWGQTKALHASITVDLGERTADPALIADAIDGFRAALETHSLEQDTRIWANLQRDLGVALLSLDRVEEAVQAYRAALAALPEAIPDRNRLGVELSLAHALYRSPSPEALVEAEQIFRRYLAEPADRLGPDILLSARRGLVLVLSKAGGLNRDAALLREAATLAEADAAGYRDSGDRIAWARAQLTVGHTWLQLARVAEGDAEPPRRAAEAFEAALAVFTRDGYPDAWAYTSWQLAEARHRMFRADGDPARLEAALRAARAAAEFYTAKATPDEWIDLTARHGMVAALLGERRGDESLLAEAREILARGQAHVERLGGSATWFADRIRQIDGIVDRLRQRKAEAEQPRSP